MHFEKILIIFLFDLLSCSFAQNKQLFQGDLCTHNNQQGICRLISDCPNAKEELKKGVRPKHCGFDKALPIVCCLNISVREPINQNRIPGEISEKKCLEYRKYIAFASYNGIPVLNRMAFPHMVSLGYEEEGSETKWGCGGSLISERFILTAGHCLLNKGLGPPTLVMYNHVLLKNDSNTRIAKILRVITHPDYKPPVNYHDIGLVEVEDLTMSLFARPACLKLNDQIDTNHVIATGWGKVGILGPLSNILLRVDLELFNQSDCQNVYKGSEKAPQGVRYDLMVCAGSYNEIKDVCQGDSGGPLQSINKNFTSGMIEIIGIVSFGKPCGQQPRWPGVYTRVSAYLKWIEDIVWPAK